MVALFIIIYLVVARFDPWEILITRRDANARLTGITRENINAKSRGHRHLTRYLTFKAKCSVATRSMMATTSRSSFLMLEDAAVNGNDRKRGRGTREELRGFLFGDFSCMSPRPHIAACTGAYSRSIS